MSYSPLIDLLASRSGSFTTPSITQNSPADGAAVGTLPILQFTGAAVRSDQKISYEVQIDTVNTFDSTTGASGNISVQAWGGGGGGGAYTGSLGPPGGGGGGAYAKTNSITVNNSTGYTVTVGAAGSGATSAGGGDNSTNGGDSGFDSNTAILAKGGLRGRSGAVTTGGTGGTTAASIGDTKLAGGNGATGSGSTGGGGGGGAGSIAAGNNASGNTAGTGGSPDGGNGGAGDTGGAGSTLGGGGGASSWSAGNGGAGARGQVIISAPVGTFASATGGTHSTDGVNDYWTFTASGTWTPTVTSVPMTDVLSNVNAGFADVTNGGNTDPFPSGETISYTVQSALANGTYYWRVRQIVPKGNVNYYSGWSATRSFTASSGPQVSASDTATISESVSVAVVAADLGISIDPSQATYRINSVKVV